MSFIERVILVVVADITIFGVGTFLNAYIFQSELVTYIINSLTFLVTAFGLFSGKMGVVKKKFNPLKESQNRLMDELKSLINSFDDACIKEVGGVTEGDLYILITADGFQVSIINSVTINKIENKKPREYLKSIQNSKFTQAFESIALKEEFTVSKESMTLKQEIKLHLTKELSEEEIAHVIEDTVKEKTLINSSYTLTTKDSIMIKK